MKKSEKKQPTFCPLEHKFKISAYFLSITPHLTLLDHTPNQESIDKINEIDFTPDQFHLINKELFIVCNLKYSDTKLTNLFIEKNFKTKATTRNWKTVLAIQQLLG